MQRILVLKANFGDSQSASANLCQALESLAPAARIEVVDLFDHSHTSSDRFVSKAYRRLIRFAPSIWGSLYSIWDQAHLTETDCFRLSKLRRALGDLLQETQPDVVVSTYPLYGSMIQDLYRDHAEWPFRLVTVITDQAPLDPAWFRTPSDLYCVATDLAAGVLREQGIPASRIRAFGFPVNPVFGRSGESVRPEPLKHGPFRILFLVSSGNAKMGKALKRLLACEDYHLTLALGRQASLKPSLAKKLGCFGARVQLVDWKDQLAQLLMDHHLVITDAGGAVLHEAIAAGCPIIANPDGLNPGQASLLRDYQIGAAASKSRQIAEWVRHCFRRDARVWRRWRDNLAKLARPDASLRIAGAILEQGELASNPDNVVKVTDRLALAAAAPRVAQSLASGRQLLCDFHIHTTYSDGKLSVPEVIDFYGTRGFDCICITDHLADSRRMIGKLGKLSRLTLDPARLVEYFEVLERERRRAWRKYSMLVMTGLEFNKDGLSKKSSAHLLGIDLTAPILDCLDLPETIERIHVQGGLAVASHPHIMKSEWGKNTLYLWENQDKFIPLLDAWEIANRNNMFNPVSAKRLPYLANSDFHKPKHIYSWKTLVSCEKDAMAIKQCIRRNERIAITLYRQDQTAPAEQSGIAVATDASLSTRPTSDSLSPAA